jgi:hypothetical protein
MCCTSGSRSVDAALSDMAAASSLPREARADTIDADELDALTDQHLSVQFQARNPVKVFADYERLNGMHDLREQSVWGSGTPCNIPD